MRMLPRQNSNLTKAHSELNQSRFKSALKYAKRAEGDEPKSPVAPNLMGISLSALGRPNEAINAFRRALRLNGNYDDARRNLAQTYLLTGQAEIAVNHLTKIQGASEATLYIIAQAFAALNKKAEGLKAASDYIELKPTDKRGYKLRAHLCMQFGLISDAIKDYERALELDPKDDETLTLASLPLARHLRTEDSREFILKALEVNPHNLTAQLRLASQYAESGQKDLSVARYYEILSAIPNQATVIKSLSEILRGDDLCALEKTASEAMKTVVKGSEDEASLLFARANIRTANGQRERADEDIKKANKFYARRSPYNFEAEERLTTKILARFASPITAETAGKICPSPIFIVGLPRSGTTLVEAMLGIHEKVVPFGERGTLGFLLEETISEELPLDAKSIATLRHEDLRLMPSVPDEAHFYVDKMPENYRIIGFLKSIYPECSIIHVRRDPRDIAVSMFRAHFSGGALNYTYDMQAMGHHFNLYARTMKHWHKIFPDQILDVHYEQLVKNITLEGQLVADFCGLEWVDEMSYPDRTKSQVLTMSANQLRQPVHTKSIGNWRQHKSLLEPFLRVLNTDDWELGP